ncbi:molybdate ABC transporter substrate-binding protein [Glycomyces arizonensis]|uniref:molybdate ABC transporter substrate-binding protein n=1 Tax=Glycomyces arizonensis TaxID=256035 RepID=UPI00040A81D4|nr:molybdate ABC transporter substrate-binding protein [Glycomyces arizonensis]
MRTIAAGTAAAALLALSACGSSADGTEDGEVGGTVTVFAAASLTETFTEIGEDFEEADPGVEVEFSFAGSSSLAAQINQGAPADVFASANPANMDKVVEAGNAEDPETFARNQLVIAVPEGNPDGVTGLADLADPALKVALCAEEVPCGAAAQTALDAAGVALTPVTYETDVKATLAKLTLGEVDAALVYRTDVAAAIASDGGVEGVEFPESAEAVNDYVLAVVNDAPNRATAEAFAAYLRSDAALAVLTAAGFQAP